MDQDLRGLLPPAMDGRHSEGACDGPRDRAFEDCNDEAGGELAGAPARALWRDRLPMGGVFQAVGASFWFKVFFNTCSLNLNRPSTGSRTRRVGAPLIRDRLLLMLGHASLR